MCVLYDCVQGQILFCCSLFRSCSLCAYSTLITRIASVWSSSAAVSSHQCKRFSSTRGTLCGNERKISTDESHAPDTWIPAVSSESRDRSPPVGSSWHRDQRWVAAHVGESFEKGRHWGHQSVRLRHCEKTARLRHLQDSCRGVILAKWLWGYNNRKAGVELRRIWNFYKAVTV